MKKVTASLTAILLMFVMTWNVLAAPSISQIIPENPKLISGNLKEGERLIVQNTKTELYKNTNVANVVEKANDDNTVITMKEILTELHVNLKETIHTQNGKEINPTLYEQLIPFVDLAVTDGEKIHYEADGKIKASVTIEAAKKMNKNKLVLMQIDPETGEVFFIVPEKINKKTGEITATFPTLGPITLLKPADIVSKNVAPDDYKSEKTAKTVKKFKQHKWDMELSEVLDTLNEKDEKNEKDQKNEKKTGKQAQKQTTDNPVSAISAFIQTGIGLTVYGADAEPLQITDDVLINPDNYSSSMGFADLAIKYGKENYLYDMSGNMEAEVRREIQDIDWKRMVLDAYPDFDVEKAEQDPKFLEELEPFVVKDSFIMQMNPIDGNVAYLYEPTIYFAKTGESKELQEDKDKNYLYKWNIYEEDREENEVPDMVIRAQYKSMGPFAVFMPKTYAQKETTEAVAVPANPSNFCWLWLLLLLLLLIAAGYYYYKKQKRRKELEEE